MKYAHGSDNYANKEHVGSIQDEFGQIHKNPKEIKSTYQNFCKKIFGENPYW